MNPKNNTVIGFDIGTRSVVGVAAVNDYDEKDHFRVEAAHVEFHTSRSMVDGQIQDINEVAKTIYKVKQALEAKIDHPITEAYVAAAGRVLRTVTVEVEKDLEPDTLITAEVISSLEWMALEKAKQEIQTSTADRFYAIGHSVMKYFLNGYEIVNLLDQRGSKIGMSVLATFLPIEVVESLYQVMEKADMKIAYLTLEPIAASQIAIPVSFRLLNIALVDIGAGTSDIAITNGGAITAYGMIPIAGDEITEAIVHQYLVDFETAERMKLDSTANVDQIEYVDIMDLAQKVDSADFFQGIQPTLEHLTTQIAERIKALNGEKAPNAVFIVGGGGQVKGFDKMLAEKIGLPQARVSLRGKEALKEIEVVDPTFKRSPEFVTPIGICYKGLADSRTDFIQVFLNDKPVKLFNKKNLTVMDIMAAEGIDPRNFLMTKGSSLNFSFNAKAYRIEGEYGEVAEIYVNHSKAVLSDPIAMNDYIIYKEAKRGRNAKTSISQFMIETLGYAADQVHPEEYDVSVNGKRIASFHQLIMEDDKIFCRVRQPEDEWYIPPEEFGEAEKEELAETVEEIVPKEADTAIEKNQEPDFPVLFLTANGKAVTLQGKRSYIFVDIFDHIEFDRSQVKGKLVVKRNGETASYFDVLENDDILEVYWEV